MRRIPLCIALVAAGLSVAGAAHAGSTQVDTYPLSKVRRGQKGYGLTTMQGLKPERFEFEVIGVNKNFLPKMDIILVKSDDPKLAVTGFWQGMSGSPLFIDSKLVCAFSYGFRFNKVAIGGCTPIEYMKAEGFKRPRNGDSVRARSSQADVPRTARATATGDRKLLASTVASRAEWLDVAPSGTVRSALERLAPPRKPWLLRAPLPPRPAHNKFGSDGGDEQGMRASSLPLAMSGFTAPAFAHAKQLMSSFPVEPMQAGGTGDPTAGPTSFTLGSSIAVQLVRGDMSSAATGTVSFVEGDGVLAFGHPLFQAGEIYAPVAAAEVHTVIPSAQSAFVLASPLRELGALVQDRQSTISADTGLKTDMIPIDIYIGAGQGKGRDSEEFHVEVLNNRFLTAALAGLATMNAVSLYLPDRDHVTATIRSKVAVKGHKPLSFVDYLYSAGGADEVVGGARGLRVLVPLLMNPFAPVDIERVELRVDLAWNANYGDIRALRLPAAELEPGKKTYVDVELTRFDGKPVIDRVPFMVPKNLAGSIVKVEVSAGDSAPLDVAPPQDLDDLMKAFRTLLPGNVYAVTIYTANEGAAIGGRLIRDLPSSALDKLHTSASTTQVESYHAIARSTAKASRVVNGKESLLVKVKNLDD